ncbi:cell division protein FtsZ [Patescibacteria group bacterium]|nr:cell division protein FtsZ [Patescibacteria group bacterium]
MSRKNIEEVNPSIETFANIKVVGVGGSGGSAVNRMVGSKIKGVEFIAVNTDAQALHHSIAPHKIHIGRNTTRGLGAGMDPDLGSKSAEESETDISSILEGADMVFITCGLGGGTGTGAAPIIADIAREAGALTVAVVTKPFTFEGLQRKDIAERGLDRLIDKVDTIITIPNDRLLQIIDKKTSLLDAFAIVDEVLKQGVQGISELITVPGLVNVDFADVKAIMKQAGSALMGIGKASGENRAQEAARAAIDSPLLELSINGATGVLFTISGSSDLSMFEVNEAAEVITSACDPEAKVIFGAVIDEALGDEVKVTVIATGFKQHNDKQQERMSVPAQSQISYQETYVKKAEERTIKQAFNKNEEEEKPVEVPRSKEEEELEIPAFLRKKMQDR